MVDSLASLHKGQMSDTKIFLIIKFSLTRRAFLHVSQSKCLTFGGMFRVHNNFQGKEGEEFSEEGGH